MILAGRAKIGNAQSVIYDPYFFMIRPNIRLVFSLEREYSTLL